LMDEFAVWGSALTQDQVSALYYSGQIADALGGSGLSYTPAEMEGMAATYYNSSHTPTITSDGLVWNYIYSASGLPGQLPQYKPGDSWQVGTTKYLLLEVGSGGGVFTEMGGGGEPTGGGGDGVPEPVTVAGMVFALAVIGFRGLRR
jgi:hypothetical protein